MRGESMIEPIKKKPVGQPLTPVVKEQPKQQTGKKLTYSAQGNNVSSIKDKLEERRAKIHQDIYNSGNFNGINKDYLSSEQANNVEVAKQPEWQRNIRSQIENQLSTQTQAINQGLAQALQANQLGITQNNQFLQEQLANFQKQKVVNDDQSATLANRRGGFL